MSMPHARLSAHLLQIAVIAALLVPVRPLLAQQLMPGVVRDELGLPIAGAEVVVGRTAQKIITDADGRFVIAVHPGVGYVTARAPGTLPTADLLRFSSDDSLDIRLDRISDTTDSAIRSAKAERFLNRIVALYASASASARTGVAFTDRDIARRTPSYTTDLFRELVGFRTVGSGVTASLYSAASKCAPTIMVDGREYLNMRINEIAPSSIKLLVAYNAYAIIPPDLRIFRLDPACGLISVTLK